MAWCPYLAFPKKAHNLNFAILITFMPPFSKIMLYYIQYSTEKTNHNEMSTFANFLLFAEFLQFYIFHQKLTLLTKILS